MIYKIHEFNLAAVKTRLAKLSERLVKIGCQPITFKQVGHEDKPDLNDSTKLLRLIHLDVIGTVPEFNGWHFMATIDHTPEGNVIRAVPGYEVPASYREGRPHCDHCKTNRMRRDTYVVVHTDKRALQVGSNCLQEFLGHNNPHQLSHAAELLLKAYDIADAAQDERWLGLRGPNVLHYHRISTRQFLAQVCAIVRTNNSFVTSKQAKERSVTSTAWLADHVMNHGYPDLEARYVVTPADFEFADKAVNWVIGKYSPLLAIEDGDYADFKRAVMNTLKGANKDISDFEHNLLTVAKAEAIEPRLCGIAAYVIEAYRRELAAVVPKVPKKNEHVGEPKQRLRDLRLKIVDIKWWLDRQFPTTFVRFEDAEGRTFVWFASGEQEFDRNVEYVVTGTVDEHTDFKGLKQTKLNRCKLAPVQQPVAA